MRAARARVVKILGTACGVGVEGSGWVAEPGVVVTNAHVVAGQDDTRVLPEGREPGLEAQAIAFDPRNDLACARPGDSRAPALELEGDPEAGTSAAILGFPLNGLYDVRAGRLGQTREVVSQDAYGRGSVRRSIVRCAARCGRATRAGRWSTARRVVTTIFAATTTGPRGGYGVPNAIVRDAVAGGGPVSTCGG